ncbi:hypothetical protein [Treponema zioleckii]|uniref:hypothetical protein n=1 Tax=Treponema zioleckii TaxID=331680 RepID=UPI00168ADF0D|nr:hypothetical protein [Treponema zioleckii]
MENIKKNGFYIGSIFRSNLFNADGITDLKTKQFFPWNEISCNVKESKHGKKYLFFAEEKKFPCRLPTAIFALPSKIFLMKCPKNVNAIRRYRTLLLCGK